MKLLTPREVSHYQPKLLSAGLRQQSDGAKVIEVIEASFDTKSVTPYCASAG